MDRRKKDELPKMQVGFIDAICLPLYQVYTVCGCWASASSFEYFLFVLEYGDIVVLST